MVTVKCDCCGREIKDTGWMPLEYAYSGGALIGAILHEDERYCDECYDRKAKELHPDSPLAMREFRICQHCGRPMLDGMTDGGGDFFAHEECFEGAMDALYGAQMWRPCPEPEFVENGGYYDAYNAQTGEWEDTGIYWTDWR